MDEEEEDALSGWVEAYRKGLEEGRDVREECLRAAGPRRAELEPLLDREFVRWLHELHQDALEEGRDIAEELLERAGPLRDELLERIEVERGLRALSRELDLDAQGLPHTLGRFEILELLKRTGFSSVYLAFDPKLGRRIALKVVNHDSLLEKGQSAWILNEARSLATLDHDGVVKVHDVGEEQGHPYLAMELLKGPSLEALIQEWARRKTGVGPEPSEELAAAATRYQAYTARIDLLQRIAEALSTCHDHGILHRDVKPANILLDASGAPNLIDFGLAHIADEQADSKLGLTQELVGTAAYIAPEQVAQNRIGADARTDQFALATVAHECFALENPFLRDTRRATLDAIEMADPPRLSSLAPGIPPDLELVLRHAHERDPADRYETVAALATDLGAILSNRPISITAPSPLRHARLWLARHRRGVRVAAAVATVLLGLFGALWWRANEREREHLRSSVSAIRPEAFDSPGEFLETFEPILNLRQASRGFSAATLRRALWGDPERETKELAERWSIGLHALFETETVFNRERAMAPPQGLYPILFELDAVLCPECPDPQGIRDWGTVVYPPDLASGGRDVFLGLLSLKDQHEVSLAFTFREVPRVEHLVPGMYWLWTALPGAETLEAETVFFLPEGWRPPVQLELHPRPPGYERIEVLYGEVPLGGSGRMVEVPPLRISDDLVTCAEFARFAATTGYDSELWRAVPDADRSSDRPVQVEFVSAMAYAAWSGGRLPLSTEVRFARDVGFTFPPLDLVGGEYTLDPYWPGRLQQTWISYDKWNQQFGDPELRGKKKEGPSPGFRMVFSCASPDTYRRLSTEHASPAAMQFGK